MLFLAGLSDAGYGSFFNLQPLLDVFCMLILTEESESKPYLVTYSKMASVIIKRDRKQ